MEIKQQELQEIKQQVSVVQLQANALNVTNQDESDVATELLHNVKQAEKFIDEKKTSITRPLMQSLASIRDLFKPLESNLKDANQIIKSKILAWTIEEQDKKDKEAERLAKRVEKGTMKASTAANKLATINEASPKSNVRSRTILDITDETIIPREWLVPDRIKITEALKRQGAVIPGCCLKEIKEVFAK